MLKWLPVITCNSKTASILWICPWNAFIPAALSRTVLCSTLELTWLRKIFHVGSKSTTAGKPSRLELKRASMSSIFTTSRCVRNLPYTYRNASSCSPPTFSAGILTGLVLKSRQARNALSIHKVGTKRQVEVGSHIAAQLIWSSEGKLLRFSIFSAFAGLVQKGAIESNSGLSRIKFRSYSPFFIKSHLVAQSLGEFIK
jgi:hypothetical protein